MTSNDITNFRFLQCNDVKCFFLRQFNVDLTLSQTLISSLKGKMSVFRHLHHVYQKLFFVKHKKVTFNLWNANINQLLDRSQRFQKEQRSYRALTLRRYNKDWTNKTKREIITHARWCRVRTAHAMLPGLPQTCKTEEWSLAHQKGHSGQKGG